MLSNTLLLLSGLLALPALASPAAEPAGISKRLTAEGEVKFFETIECGGQVGQEWTIFANAATVVPFNTNIRAFEYFNLQAGADCIVSMWQGPNPTQTACDTSDAGALLFELPVREMINKCLIIEQVPQCLQINC